MRSRWKKTVMLQLKDNLQKFPGMISGEFSVGEKAKDREVM